MPKFLRDLKRGNDAQTLVAQLFDSCGLQSEVVDSKSPDRSFWDITSIGRGLSFTTEVKFDEYEARSGNVAIETFNPRLGKPSGIGVTKAFFWAHVLVGKVVWLARTDDLRHFIDTEKPKRIIDAGGDGNAQLLLYDSSIILPAIFHRVDNLKSATLLKHLKDQCKCQK